MMQAVILVLVQGAAALSTNAGAALQRAHKVAARANRLDDLLRSSRSGALTTAEGKEMAGLTSADTYDEDTFSAEHATFKDAHNRAFATLARFCGGTDGDAFFLDGPAGKTTQALFAAGFDRSRLCTANWHPSTCAALLAAPHGLANVANAHAEDALRTHFSDVPFSALYLDGCGGATRPVIACIDALFSQPGRQLPPILAFGFTLTEAEPTGRSLMDREVDVNRALMAACRMRGYAMRHVADEPEAFGVDASVPKREGGTRRSSVL